ncbi:Uncharacterised protein [Amycolatopsis camponoti]|uniref:Uncharacterized protein n=1 Tax=Amycolatopsis camponoti TaxID=2606593 RepID=A0A6I8LV76_9PSEU|nr:Uncharacterised protein [Amycolatopsis camponoti]
MKTGRVDPAITRVDCPITRVGSLITRELVRLGADDEEQT